MGRGGGGGGIYKVVKRLVSSMYFNVDKITFLLSELLKDGWPYKHNLSYK